VRQVSFAHGGGGKEKVLSAGKKKREKGMRDRSSGVAKSEENVEGVKG